MVRQNRPYCSQILSLLLAVPTLAYSQGAEPKLTAERAVVMDAASGIILWSKNANQIGYPASTTKILTALLLIENTNPGDVIIGPPGVDKVGESSLHIKPGEKLTADALLKGLMLRSANDAAYMVAIHIGGSVKGFAKMMNERALALGCTDTLFQNPHGLHDENHFTTARDLALIAQEAMKNERFRAVVRLQSSAINRPGGSKDLLLHNRNEWLKKDPSAIGIKTGYTKAAGKCFVGAASRENWQIVTVIMNSTSWVEDQQKLTDWSFATFQLRDVTRGQLITKIPVSLGDLESFSAVVQAPDQLPASKDYSWQIDWNSDSFRAPVLRGGKIGVGYLKSGGQKLGPFPVVSLQNVETVPFKSSVWPVAVGWGLPWTLGATMYVRGGRKRLRTTHRARRKTP